ncbi:MAG: tautomerase family protein [Lachnospiraceae bacterium]|nr:tautomerase family protein [Lachnospiraceae bacterium]
MPHVEIKCFPGRTEEQKQACAEKVTEVLAETLGCKVSSVSITIKEVAEEAWKTEVWDKSIVPDEKYMYKQPGYTCEEQKK